MFKKFYIIFLFFSAQGCLSGGTHGKIESYQYAVSKYDLSNDVLKVIESGTNILRDTLKGYDGGVNYYNDGIRYLNVIITKDSDICNYVIHFYGDSTYWDTAKNSALSIVYANFNGVGGSEGRDDFKGKEEVRDKLIEVFQSEFIDRLDKQVGKEHKVVE